VFLCVVFTSATACFSPFQRGSAIPQQIQGDQLLPEGTGGTRAQGMFYLIKEQVGELFVPTLGRLAYGSTV
jgi:hypothetical protein